MAILLSLAGLWLWLNQPPSACPAAFASQRTEAGDESDCLRSEGEGVLEGMEDNLDNFECPQGESLSPTEGEQDAETPKSCPYERSTSSS